MKLRTNVIMCGSLGALAVLSLALSHLALTDIRHGEGDLTAEWAVLQVSFLVIAAFSVATAILLPRVWSLAGGRSAAAQQAAAVDGAKRRS